MRAFFTARVVRPLVRALMDFLMLVLRMPNFMGFLHFTRLFTF